VALRRYQLPDEYVIEELRREYNSADLNGRLRLLRRLKRNGELSTEIGLLGLHDSAPQIRQWFAKNTSYGGYFETQRGNAGLAVDPDKYVRAAVFENPEFLFFRFTEDEQVETFHRASRLERLAMFRNPSVSRPLVERVFDPAETSLGIDMEERKDLALAYLSNATIIGGDHSLRDELNIILQKDEKHFAALWRLAGKWADLKDFLIPALVYRHVMATGKVKAKAYVQCGMAVARRSILENCAEFDKLTLDLGLSDSDEECREIAKRMAEAKLSREKPKEEANTRWHRKYGLHIALGVLRVLVAVAMLQFLTTGFEKVAFVILVLTYAAVAVNAPWRGIALAELSLAQIKRHSQVLVLLKDSEETKSKIEDLDAELEKANGGVWRARVNLIIDAVSFAIVGAIAMGSLFVSIVGQWTS
jgi:hypothetical protein